MWNKPQIASNERSQEPPGGPPNSIGEGNNKMIAVKYRYLDPSMVGVLDLNVSSNSDIGMSGSFVPFVNLYDGYFFTEERQPCKKRYDFEQATSSGARASSCVKWGS